MAPAVRGSGGGLALTVEAVALVAASVVGVGLVVWWVAGWMLRPHGTPATLRPAPPFAAPPPPPPPPTPPPPPPA